jgi:hypothetical protein
MSHTSLNVLFLFERPDRLDAMSLQAELRGIGKTQE